MSATTYGSYLKLDELLSLQQPKSDEHDEVLFIIIHQVYELWFKQVLHELQRLKGALLDGEHTVAARGLERILTILKTLVSQIDILETMTPTGFLSFRTLLETSSGFQSLQFREVEFELGLRREKMIGFHDEAGQGRLRARARELNLWQAFVSYLAKQGYGVDPGEPQSESTPVADDRVQAALVKAYRDDPPTAQLCELMVDFDEGLQEWRYRHVKMVERTIGTKSGSGGSSGAEYLRKTLFAPVFPDLWAMRQHL